MRTLPTRNEVRHAVRALRRSPGFTSVSILSLGLAIALAMTMFGVLDALIRPRYPFTNQDELFSVSWEHVQSARLGRPGQLGDEMRDGLAHQVPGIIATASVGWSGTMGGLIRSGSAHANMPGIGRAASSTFFQMLGVHPLYGRLFAAADSEPSAEPVAVISDELWRRLFGGRTDFAPFTAFVGEQSFTVVGVLPPRVAAAFETDFWTARRDTRLASSELGGPRSIYVRAKAGLSANDIRRALSGLNAELARDGGLQASATDMRVTAVAHSQLPEGGLVFGLTAAALAVLLIACVNIANLQLARGMVRVRDLAVRAALGASRRDIVRLLVTESMLVASAGGIAAATLSAYATPIVRAVIPPSVAQLGFVEPQMSWRVWIASLVTIALAAIACGLAPAIRVAGLDLNDVLKTRAGTGLTRVTRQRYATLVAVEVAAALALLVGAGLVGGSAQTIRTVTFGFRPGQVLTADIVTLGRSQAERLETMAGLESSVLGISGVTAAAFSERLPWNLDSLTTDDPRQRMPQRLSSFSYGARVTADYLRTLGIPVIDGRDFATGDDGSVPSVIVDSEAAKLYWPTSDPVGRMIKLGSPSGPLPWVRVIGVARHVRYFASRSWEGTTDEPEFYLLAREFGAERTAANSWATLFVRGGGGDSKTLLSSLIRVIGAHGNIRVSSLQSFDDFTGRAPLVESQNFLASLFVAFAGFGLLLAMIGVYGVVAHSVAQRTREFGVRIAFGARTSDVLLLVMREGNVAIFGGLALGLIVAEWGSRLLALAVVAFDEPVQAAVFIAAPVAILCAAGVATLMPAIRATRVDPVEALRSD